MYYIGGVVAVAGLISGGILFYLNNKEAPKTTDITYEEIQYPNLPVMK